MNLAHRSLLLFTVCCSTTFAGELLFKNVRLFDGESVIPRTSVLVRDGKIANIGEQVSSTTAETIEGDGRTLLPGLIDCHVHAFFPAHLQHAAVFGVTTQLDMMSVPRMAALYRQQQADGKAHDRADLFSAGAAVTVKGGHGTQFGFLVPTLEKASDAAEFIKARVDEGSDYIKIICDDGKLYGFEIPTLSKEMVKASIEAAHAHGKIAVAHISTQKVARMVVELGIDGLVHGFADEPIDDRFIALALEKQIFVVPTLAVMNAFESPADADEALADAPHLTPFVNNTARAALKRRFPGADRFKLKYANLREAIAKLYAAGVPILAGTDSPNPGTSHGISMHQEIELLVDARLTPKAALAAATSLPAKLFKLEDRGRVAVGLRADLLLVEGDPTTNILASRNIVGVWKEGHVIDRETLREQVAASKTEPSHDAAENSDAEEPAGVQRGEFGS